MSATVKAVSNLTLFSTVLIDSTSTKPKPEYSYSLKTFNKSNRHAAKIIMSLKTFREENAWEETGRGKKSYKNLQQKMLIVR